MAFVEVVGRVWDGSASPIPTSQEPEVWFRPDKARIVTTGAILPIEVQATTFTKSTGYFTAKLENSFAWKIVVRWLVSGTEPDKRAYGYVEFPAFWPESGGDIKNLPPVNPEAVALAYGWGPPPDFMDSWTNVMYMDVTGPMIGVYGPEGSVV